MEERGHRWGVLELALLLFFLAAVIFLPSRGGIFLQGMYGHLGGGSGGGGSGGGGSNIFVCGDGICDSAGENCNNCFADCDLPGGACCGDASVQGTEACDPPGSLCGGFYVCVSTCACNTDEGSSGTYLIGPSSTTQYSFFGGSLSSLGFDTNIDALVLQSGTLGTYTSRVFDLNTPVLVDLIDWSQGVPYGQPLPDYGWVETEKGGADMTSNVLLLHMDESGSTFFDTSGEGNDAVCALQTCPAVLTPGIIGYAVDFDGVDDTITVNDDASLNFLNSETFTLSLWVKGSSSADNQRILHKITSSDGYALWYSSSASSYTFRMRSNSVDTDLVFNANVLDGLWHHLVVMRDAASVSVWVDGNLVASMGLSSLDDLASSSPLCFGSRCGAGGFFDGQIDEIAFWDRSIPAQQIKDMHKRGVLSLLFSIRTCDDSSCSGEGFTSIGGYPFVYVSASQNRYVQYQVQFTTLDSVLSPELYDVNIYYGGVAAPPGGSSGSPFEEEDQSYRDTGYYNVPGHDEDYFEEDLFAFEEKKLEFPTNPESGTKIRVSDGESQKIEFARPVMLRDLDPRTKALIMWGIFLLLILLVTLLVVFKKQTSKFVRGFPERDEFGRLK